MPFPGRAAATARAVAIAIAAAWCCAAWAQQPAAPAQAPLHPSVSASTPASRAAARPASAARPVAKRTVTHPLWSELTPAQRQSLAPLAAPWDTVSEVQKRKWLAMSENFSKMPAPEQAKLHSRMTDWVALSPQQRTQARLNFGETQKLSPDDKKAKWEAYQALPPEEKKKLAERAAKPPVTAAAVKPVASDKLAHLPKTHRSEPRPPRIAVAPTGERMAPPGPSAPQPSAAPTN